MVELFNRHVVERQACDQKHGRDEPCNENETYEEVLYDLVREDTMEVLATDLHHYSSKAPIGAMWFEDYKEPNLPTHAQDWAHLNEDETARVRNPDGTMPVRHPSFIFQEGPQLTVKTPGGRWVIDSRASNCGSPYDYNHRCWIRQGVPPHITVDKNGPTCSAGAGSIQCGDYHGFLQNGALT